MPLIVKPGYSLFFAHVPKTGGTSIEDYLIRRFGRILIAGKGPRVTYSTATHLAANDLVDFLPDGLALSFALVRDPVKRAISEFRFQYGAARLVRLGFSTWLRVMVAAARREPRLHENHIRPQVDLIPDGSEIFKLENGFAPLIARIDEATGTKTPQVAVQHLQKSDHKVPVTCYREDVALIADYYAEDYHHLGYPKPDLARYPSDPHAALRGVIAAPLARMLVARQRLRWPEPRAVAAVGAHSYQPAHA